MTKGKIKKMSDLINSAVFPGIQGGPLEHIIAAKAVAFGEALTNEYEQYIDQVMKNAQVMSEYFVKKGYKVISGGTDAPVCSCRARVTSRASCGGACKPRPTAPTSLSITNPSFVSLKISGTPPPEAGYPVSLPWSLKSIV